MEHTCIGGRFDEQFPQDQMAPSGAPDFVIINDTGWIIGTLSLDEMLDKRWNTGQQEDGTTILAPYCLMCGDPMHGATGVLCDTDW